MPKKYTNNSGIYSKNGRTVNYDSTDFYVRTYDGDVKFSTKKLAKKTAVMANKAAGSVVAWCVTKITHQIIKDGKIISNKIKEIEDDRSIYELMLNSNENF